MAGCLPACDSCNVQQAGREGFVCSTSLRHTLWLAISCLLYVVTLLLNTALIGGWC